MRGVSGGDFVKYTNENGHELYGVVIAVKRNFAWVDIEGVHQPRTIQVTNLEVL